MKIDTDNEAIIIPNQIYTSKAQSSIKLDLGNIKRVEA